MSAEALTPFNGPYNFLTFAHYNDPPPQSRPKPRLSRHPDRTGSKPRPPNKSHQPHPLTTFSMAASSQEEMEVFQRLSDQYQPEIEVFSCFSEIIVTRPDQSITGSPSGRKEANVCLGSRVCPSRPCIHRKDSCEIPKKDPITLQAALTMSSPYPRPTPHIVASKEMVNVAGEVK